MCDEWRERPPLAQIRCRAHRGRLSLPMVGTARNEGCFVQVQKSPPKPRRVRSRHQLVSSWPVYPQLKRTWNARSGLRGDLHVDTIGVLDVQTGKVAV